VGFIAWHQLTSRFWLPVRHLFRIISLILLFSPTQISVNDNLYAPSGIIIALDLLFKMGDSAEQALINIMMHGFFITLSYLFFILLLFVMRKNKPKNNATNQHQPTMQKQNIKTA